jgi:putative transposase
MHRVERLMRRAKLVARPRRRRLPFDMGQRPEHAIAPNVLDRQFAASVANQKWAADFTYLWTAEGWLYVAIVLDLFSRRVVGWSMSSQMTSQFVTAAGAGIGPYWSAAAPGAPPQDAILRSPSSTFRILVARLD